MEQENKKNARVLVVEDDAFLQNIYEAKLKKEGFEVETANNGQEALDLARQKKPDVILLDLIMPIKDGFETLRELKEDTALKDIKVAILSNLSQEEDKQKLMELGAIDYVVKANISFGEIVEKIQGYLKN